MAYVLYSGIVSGQRRWNSPWVIVGAVASGAAIIRDTHIPATGKHIIACAEDVKCKLADAGQKALGAVAKTAQTVAAHSPPKITFRRGSTMPQREPNPSTSINSSSFPLPVLPQDLEKNSAQPVDEAMMDSSASREQDAYILKEDGALEHVLFSHPRPARASIEVEPTIHDGEDRTLCSGAGSQMTQTPNARRSRAKGWVDQISLFVGATNSKRILALEAAGGILKTGADALKSKVEGVVGATQVAGLALARNILWRAKTRSLRYWVNIAAHHISAFARRNKHLARSARINQIRFGDALLRTLTRKSLLGSFILHIVTGVASRQVLDTKPPAPIDAATIAEIAIEIAVRVCAFLTTAAIVAPLVVPLIAPPAALLGISAFVVEDVIQGVVQGGITLAWAPVRGLLQHAWGSIMFASAVYIQTWKVRV